MSLPNPEKTWLYATVLNPLTGTNIGNQKAMMIAWKNQRKLFGHTVAGSGNGTVGGMGTGDHWATVADIPDSTRGTWIVMQDGNGAQDILSYNNFGQPNWRLEHSPGGLFVGGSSSALPTATDGSGTLYPASGGSDGSLFFGGGSDGGSNPQIICNMWCSSDLQCFRSSFWLAGNPFAMIWYDAFKPVTGYTPKPVYAMVDKQGNNMVTNQHIGWFNNLVIDNEGDGKGMFKSQGPHGAMNMTLTAEGTGTGAFTPMSNAVFRTKNKVTGLYELPDWTPGICEPITHADGGRHGKIFDAWIVGGSDNAGATFATGSTVPLDGSKQFVIIGDVMLPWNGTPFRTT